MRIKIEIDGAEALNDFIPALLRKHDKTSHKLAHIFIDAVTSSWQQSVERYESSLNDDDKELDRALGNAGFVSAVDNFAQK